MSKTKKQVRVRTKKGKTYMRSMMVNSAEAISRRATHIALKQDDPKSTKPGLISRLFFRNGRANSKRALASINNEASYNKAAFSAPGSHPAWQKERLMGQGGSTHALLAFLVGHNKTRLLGPTQQFYSEFTNEVAARGADYVMADGKPIHLNAAAVRRSAGFEAGRLGRSWQSTIQPSNRRDVFDAMFYRPSGATTDVGNGLHQRYGNAMEYVPQNPNKWVR